MKSWLLAFSAALLALSYAAPRSFSQERGNASPSDESSSGYPAEPSQVALAPTTVESADPNEVKHNGG